MSGFIPTDLIREVKIRPGIYNKDALIPPRRERRQRLWMEVAESLTPPEEWAAFTQDEKEARVGEVTNKWKNLRDHFYREVKLVESGDSNKKRKYIYYDDMEFVRPYVGYKLPPLNKRLSKNFESVNTSQEYGGYDSDIDMENYLKMCDNDDENRSKKKPMIQTRSSTSPEKKYTSKSKLNKSNTSSNSQKEVMIKNFDILQKKHDGKNPTFKMRESDISFCLSLVPTLRQMVGSRKLSAKIDILKVIRKHLDEIEQNEARVHTKQEQVNEVTDEFTDDDINDKCDPLNSTNQKRNWRMYK